MKVAALFNSFVQNQLGCIGDHEVLLENTEQFSLTVWIIWVEEEGQVFQDICLVKVNPISDDAAVYRIKIKETQAVLCLCFVTWHINVIKGRSQIKVSKWYLIAFARADQPALVRNPVVWLGKLLVITENLFEETKVVVQTNTIPVETKSSNGIQEAGCQTAQTTIPKRWFHFHAFDLDKVFPSFS